MTKYEENQERLKDLYRQLAALEALQATQRVVTFKPIPGTQQETFFEDQTAQIRLVMGDNRSGKSVVGTQEAIAHSLGYRPWLPEEHPNRIVRLCDGNPIPVPNTGRILAQNFQSAIKQNIWRKLVEWAPRGWYTIRKDNRGIPVEVNWKNGSVWHLMSDKQDDMDFEGTNGHWFWVDEPCGYRKFVALQRGLTDFNGHCWMTLTPLSQFWIADIIQERAGDPDNAVKVYEFNIEDNTLGNGGYLSRQAIDSFVANLRDDEKAARVGHEWLHMTGRVYKEWQAKPPYWIEPFDIPDNWPRVCVIDPHPKKPVAVMWAAVNPDDQWFVYRELFDENLVTIKDVANKMKELEQWDDPKKREKIAVRLIDSASREQERTSGYTVQSMFSKCGITCLAAPKRNAQVGYNAIHEALKMKYDWDEPSLAVFNVCPIVKRNFLRFVWKEWESSKDRDLKGERQEVLKNEDDFIDDIRYIFQSGLTYSRLIEDREKYEPDTTLNPSGGFSMFTGHTIGQQEEVTGWPM